MSIPMTPLQKRMEEDSQWACQADELQQHAGSFVAIRNKRVVAVGPDEDRVRKQAAALENCPEEEILLWYEFPPGFEMPPDLDIPY
jgi:hypothetical protein